MNANPEAKKDLPREEDYRDYADRNIGDGWPYPDQDVGPRKSNDAYGRPPAGLESDGNPGAEIASDPAIRSEGGPSLSQGIAQEAIEDDGLEEAVYDHLTRRDDLDEDQITVTVHAGVADLTGFVETAEASAVAAQIVGGVPGILSVRNRLAVIGVDSHIPSDSP